MRQALGCGRESTDEGPKTGGSESRGTVPVYGYNAHARGGILHIYYTRAASAAGPFGVGRAG